MTDLPTEVRAFKLGNRLFEDRRAAAIATVMKALGGHHAETQRIATVIVDLRHDLRPCLDWLDQPEVPAPASTGAAVGRKEAPLKVVRR
jgi:hypothetical protein